MYKESLKKIISMVKISQALDEAGYFDEAAILSYNAFELAEDTVYKLAEELDKSMKKTASVNREAKIQEIENMVKIANPLANLLKGIGGWAGRQGAGLAENATEMAAKKLKGKAANEIEEAAAKSLRNRGGTWLQKIGDFLTGAGDDAAEHGLNKFVRQGDEIANPAVKRLQKQILDMGDLDDPVKQQAAAALQSQIDKLPATIRPQQLTNLGQLGLGAAGVGAVGIGAAGSNAQRKLRQEKAQAESLAGGQAIPSVGATGGATGGQYGTPQPIGAGGTFPGAAGGAATGAAMQMAGIEQRINSLEQVVNAIRAKVGV